MNIELKKLEKLVEELHAGLMESNEQYRLLVLLRKTQDEFSSESARAAPGVVPERGSNPPDEKTKTAEKRPLRAAVFEILSASERPLAVPEILAELAAIGASPSSKNPRASLSSNLSQDQRFENVIVDGKPVWQIRKAGEPAGGKRTRTETHSAST